MSATVHDNKIFIQGGLSNQSYMAANAAIQEDVQYTSDGSSWTQASATGPLANLWGATMLSLGGDLYIMGGCNYPTKDLTIYTGSNNLNYNSSLYCSGAYVQKEIYKSTDNGVNWSDVGDMPGTRGRMLMSATVHSTGMFIQGGLSNQSYMAANAAIQEDVQKIAVSVPASSFYTVTTSASNSNNKIRNWEIRDNLTDGANYVADWSARSAADSAVFDNKLWQFGGCTNSNAGEGCKEMWDSTQSDEYWYSSDGLSWIEETDRSAPTPKWVARKDLKTLNFDKSCMFKTNCSNKFYGKTRNVNFVLIWGNCKNLSISSYQP